MTKKKIEKKFQQRYFKLVTAKNHCDYSIFLKFPLFLQQKNQ